MYSVWLNRPCLCVSRWSTLCGQSGWVVGILPMHSGQIRTSDTMYQHMAPSSGSLAEQSFCLNSWSCEREQCTVQLRSCMCIGRTVTEVSWVPVDEWSGNDNISLACNQRSKGKNRLNARDNIFPRGWQETCKIVLLYHQYFSFHITN